jgi:hypothetical protein
MACISPLSEAALRSVVRERLADGRLPTPSTWMPNPSCGSGRICRLCDLPIERWQVEYGVNDLRGSRMSFHFGCHEAYQIECAWGITGLGAKHR